MMTIATFIFGLIIGSFIACMIDRKKKAWSWKQAFLRPSRCMSCERTLKPWHNIPIVSYVVQRGRCAYCGARIPAHLPLIELTVAVLAVLLYHLFS